MGNLDLLGCCTQREDRKYFKYMEECKSAGVPFEDKEFPPTKRSLIEDWNSQDPDVLENKDEW